MADRIEWFNVTVPAGTLKTAPVVIPCVFPQGDVTEIDVKVPPGPQGNVGFFIGAGGSQYVPRTRYAFIMPDADYFTWPMQNAINSGSWSVTAYNTDVFDHAFQVFFQVNENPPIVSPQGQAATSSSAGIPASVTASPAGLVAATDPLSADALIASVPSEDLASLGLS